jgi:glutathione S-transferase
MSDPVLYNYDLDEDCYRVRLTAACLGQPLSLHNIDMFPGREHLTEPMLRLNPAGRLPVLVAGDLVLTQTGAILLHLAEADPERRLLPSDPADRARTMDWLMFAQTAMAVAGRARAASMLSSGEDREGLRAAARAGLRIMDDHMTRQGILGLGFFAGPAASLADLALFPAFALSRDFNVDHDEFPALRLWARRVRRLPGFVTMPGIPDYH